MEAGLAAHAAVDGYYRFRAAQEGGDALAEVLEGVAVLGEYDQLLGGSASRPQFSRAGATCGARLAGGYHTGTGGCFIVTGRGHRLGFPFGGGAEYLL